MTTAELLAQVHAEARQLKPGRVAKTVAIAPFVAVGWLLGTVVRGLWLVVAWCWTAGVVGYRLGRAKRP